MVKLYRHSRHRTSYQTMVETPMGVFAGTIVDVSAGGAQLAGLPGVLHGDRLTLLFNGMKLTGYVRWAKVGKVGIAFLIPLSGDVVASLRQGERRSA